MVDEKRLAEIREETTWMSEYTHRWLVEYAPTMLMLMDLLAEVDRLRAENNARIAELEGACEQALIFVSHWCKSIGSTEWSEYLEGKRIESILTAIKED